MTSLKIDLSSPSVAQVVSIACLYVDTTFRNSIELSRYGHFTANPATREPRGECDETVKIARMIRPVSVQAPLSSDLINMEYYVAIL